MNEVLLYWITRLDNVREMFILSLMLSIMGLIIVGVASLVLLFTSDKNDYDAFVEKIGRLVKIGFAILIFSTIGAIFVPSTKEAVAIYLVPKVLRNEEVKEVSEKSLEVLNLKVNEWLMELKRKK